MPTTVSAVEDSPRAGRADCSASVSTAAAAASDFDCVMNVLKIDVHLDCSAVAHHGAICCEADWSAAAAVTTVAVRGFFEASTLNRAIGRSLGGRSHRCRRWRQRLVVLVVAIVR